MSVTVAVTHPLDPLTADEINTAISAARTDARLAGAVFPSITLQEPPKSDVLKWQRGQALRRRALWLLTAVVDVWGGNWGVREARLPRGGTKSWVFPPR